MTLTTTHYIVAAGVALLAYTLGKQAGAKPPATTTSTGSMGTGNAAGPEWWSYAGSWR